MGCATKVMMLLTATSTPSPVLRQYFPPLMRFLHFHPQLEYLRGSNMITIPSYKTTMPSISTRSLHASSTAIPLSSSSSSSSSPHPWPEWVDFVNRISSAGYFTASDANNYDLFNFSVEFSLSCLSFARDQFKLFGKLRRTDIEVLINNDTLFSFEDKEDSSQRIRVFLLTNAPFTEEIAVDLMKYILSYPTISKTNSNFQLEQSVRTLLLAISNFGISPDGYGRPHKSVNFNAEMKRGDWICPKCSFMNFARNGHCIECDGSRPERAKVGGEWECPKCNFFNYGRNSACLRCDCKRPNCAKMETLLRKEPPSSSIGETASHVITKRKDRSLSSPLYKRREALESGERMNEVPFVPFPPNHFAKKKEKGSDLENEDEAKASNETIDMSEEAKTERWFKRVSQINDIKELGEVPDEDFPTIMPMRKGTNRFVLTKRKTPLERKLASSSQKNLNSPQSFDLS